MPAPMRSDTKRRRATPTLAAVNGSSRTLDSVTSKASPGTFVRPLHEPGTSGRMPGPGLLETREHRRYRSGNGVPGKPPVALIPAAGTVTSQGDSSEPEARFRARRPAGARYGHG